MKSSVSSASCEVVARSETAQAREAEHFADKAQPFRVEDPGSSAGSTTDLK